MIILLAANVIFGSLFINGAVLFVTGDVRLHSQYLIIVSKVCVFNIFLNNSDLKIKICDKID